MSDNVLTRRSPALLGAAFSAIALLLTGIGTYGVLNHTVAQRRQEIGVRMALGADPVRIRSSFLAFTIRLLALGMGCGLVGAWLVGRFMQTALFHVAPLSGPVLLDAAAVVAAVSLAARLIPAHRASRIAPSEVLSAG